MRTGVSGFSPVVIVGVGDGDGDEGIEGVEGVGGVDGVDGVDVSVCVVQSRKFDQHHAGQWTDDLVYCTHFRCPALVMTTAAHTRVANQTDAGLSQPGHGNLNWENSVFSLIKVRARSTAEAYTVVQPRIHELYAQTVPTVGRSRGCHRTAVPGTHSLVTCSPVPPSILHPPRSILRPPSSILHPHPQLGRPDRQLIQYNHHSTIITVQPTQYNQYNQHCSVHPSPQPRTVQDNTTHGIGTTALARTAPALLMRRCSFEHLLPLQSSY